MLWYCTSRAELEFQRQENYYFVRLGGGDPALAGVLVERSDDLVVLRKQLLDGPAGISVWIVPTQFAAVAGLQRLDKVRSLAVIPDQKMHFRSLADPGGPADLRLLSRLPNLEFLDLGSIETRDTSGLSQLEKLRAFRVMSLDHPFDVSSVCRLPRLRSLDLHARLTHAAALAEMPELESLQIEIHSAKDEDEVRRAVEHCSALRRLAVSCSRARGSRA